MTAQLAPVPELQRSYVRAGAAWLDEQVGDDWWTSVNFDTLDLREPCHCVIGQVIGDYPDVMRDVVGLDTLSVVFEERLKADAWAVEHGFAVDVSVTTLRACSEEWDLLEQAWREEITARRERDGAP